LAAPQYKFAPIKCSRPFFTGDADSRRRTCRMVTRWLLLLLSLCLQPVMPLDCTNRPNQFSAGTSYTRRPNRALVFAFIVCYSFFRSVAERLLWFRCSFFSTTLNGLAGKNVSEWDECRLGCRTVIQSSNSFCTLV